MALTKYIHASAQNDKTGQFAVPAHGTCECGRDLDFTTHITTCGCGRDYTKDGEVIF